MPIPSRAAAGAVAATAAAGLALATLTTASARTPIEPAAGTPAVKLVAQLPTRAALDASPDPKGRVIYFTANGSKGPAIYAVPAVGGAKRIVLAGAPLRGPRGIAVSNDARRLYVADTKAGHILVVPVRGGRPHVLAGTAGSAPRGVEVQTRGGHELVVYSGRAADGKPAVLRISAAGAARPGVVLEGAPLRSPDGVAVSKTGAIYVTDHGAGGRALRIAGGKVGTVASGVRLGDPAGIALTLDESRILISSLDPARGTAQVVIVDAKTGQASTFDDVIGANHSAGGLHRARAADPMGWADVSRSGRVYRVDP
jgi:sugar lactone lactonase YvrE